MKTALFRILPILATCLPLFPAGLPADAGHIDIYVTPYYQSVGPAIDVGKYSAGLASQDRTIFLTTIHKMDNSWDELSFAELYVASIRLYDLGFRKAAIYWYYSAEYRGRLFTKLVDRAKLGEIGAPGYEILSSQNAFYQLLGPYINGYAFGDLDYLAGVLRAVQKRETAIPKMMQIYPDVAFIDSSSWEAANSTVNSGMEKLLNVIRVKKDQIAQQRIDTGVAAKFSVLENQDLPKADGP